MTHFPQANVSRFFFVLQHVAGLGVLSAHCPDDLTYIYIKYNLLLQYDRCDAWPTFLYGFCFFVSRSPALACSLPTVQTHKSNIPLYYNKLGVFAGDA